MPADEERQDDIESLTKSFSIDPGATRFIDPPVFDSTETYPPHHKAIAGFEVLGELGRGGMGVVYLAKQTALNRKVALKTIIGNEQPDRHELRRFLLEAEAAAAIKHPAIVQVYEVGEHQGQPYMALELLSGGTLAARLAMDQKLHAKAAATLLAQVAKGIAAAHRASLVHRDLKPGNILFDDHGLPKITDFGLVKKGTGELTQTGAMMGTPAYMAPEQGRDSKYVGPPADIWALGVILYECITGTRPFRGSDVWELLRHVADADPVSPRSVTPEVPRDLELICLRCLEKSPGDRYASAEELAADLERFVAGEPVSVRSAGFVERSYKWAKRHPTSATAWGLGFASLALLVLGSVIFRLWLRAETASLQANESFQREVKARQAEAHANETATQAREALSKSERERRRERAEAAKSNVLMQLPDLRRRALWPQAQALVSEAIALLRPDAEMEVMTELELAFDEIRLLSRLDEIRMSKATLAADRPDQVWNARNIREAYRLAFADAGWEFEGNNSAMIAAKIMQSPVKDEIVAALDDWAWGIKEDFADSIWETTAEVTGRRWRSGLRFTSLSAPDALRISAEVPTDELTPSLVIGLGFTMRLFLHRDQQHALKWLEHGARRYPGDYWVNFYLGIEYLRYEDKKSAAGAFRAAVALRPDSALPQRLLMNCLEPDERGQE